MIRLIERQYIPDNTELKLFEEINSIDFPWFKSPSVYGSKHYCFFHSLMMRTDVENQTVGNPGDINSIYYPHFENIFLKFCKQNNIEVKKIFRASLNLTCYHEDLHSNIHVDHVYPHRNFIMYLSEASGDTYIYDESVQTMFSISPKLHKAIIFDGVPHAQGFCKMDEVRIVLVFTFE